MSIDVMHGPESNSKAYGLVTWDRMQSLLPGDAFTQHDRFGRGALSFTNDSKAGAFSFQSGISGLLSSGETFWENHPATNAASGTSRVSIDEKSGRAYVDALLKRESGYSLEAGADIKAEFTEVSRIGTGRKTRNAGIDNVRSGGFAEYSLEAGPYGALFGIRAEYFSAFTALGMSPQLTVSRKLGGLARMALNGALRYEPHGDGPEIASIALSDTTHPPLDFKTLDLKRVWYGDMSLAGMISGISLECTGFLKYYDREFKLIDGIHRAYFGGIATGDDGDISYFAKPTCKRIAQGVEANAKGRLGETLRVHLGAAIQSIENEYAGGAFHPDRNDFGLSMKALCFWTVAPRNLVSVNMTAERGRPAWSREQISGDDFYSARFPDLYYLSARYSIDRRIHQSDLTLYFEINNVLNQTPPVYQSIRNDGSYRNLYVNGIYPLMGLRISF
jgi:hypothetical protein